MTTDKLVNAIKRRFPKVRIHEDLGFGVKYSSGEGSLVEIDGSEWPAFDYYAADMDPKEKFYVMGVIRPLMELAEENGHYWECHDPGTWVLVEN